MWRRSLSAKLLVPVVVFAACLLFGLGQWTARRQAAAFDADVTAHTARVFDELRRSIRATGGAAADPLAGLIADQVIAEGTIVAGDDAEVVATSLDDIDPTLDSLSDQEAAEDLRSIRVSRLPDLVIERSPDNGGERDVVDGYGMLRVPVRAQGSIDFESAAVHFSIDVSQERAAAAARARDEMVKSTIATLALMLGLLLTARLVLIRRLRRFAEEVGAIGAGDAAWDLTHYGTDEIGQLAAAYRDAFSEIGARNRDLAVSNQWLEEEMTRRQAAEAETRHQARHDALTGLANRKHALEFTNACLGVCDWKSDRRIAVFHLNLDRFKIVNESLGYEAGDSVLREIARRLAMALPIDDLVARISGDEFVIVVEQRTEQELGALAVMLLESLELAVELGNGNDVFGSGSIGVAVARQGDDPETLFHKAGLALSRAKNEGRARFVWFDEAMQEAIEARAETEIALRHAIEESRPGRSQLELYYQPIIDLDEARVRGFESLVRWQRDGVYISPAEFVTIAEETGLIVPLGQWIVKHAAAQAGQWQRMFPDRPPTVAINVSGRQLAEDNVTSLVRSAITAHRLDPSFITLELTESVLLDDVGRARATLDELKSLGIKLAIDDFGTGYSSLTYLRQFPIDVVKVDQSFVRNLGSDEQDSTIVAAVVAMARALQLRVVCEGVETAEQVAGLIALGADDGQGWYFAKALTVEQATAAYAGGIDVVRRAVVES